MRPVTGATGELHLGAKPEGEAAMHYRICPDDSKRIVFSIRGVVEESGTRERGWWIFREEFLFVHVRLNRDQWLKSSRTIRNQHTGENLPDLIKLRLQKGEELANFAVGSSVGLTFSYADELEQFFTGAVPLRIKIKQPLDDDTILENEV